jgi:hypothetical protein
MTRVPLIRFLVLGLLLALVVGCGGRYKATTLRGRVLQDGQPIHLDSSEVLTLGFSYEVQPGYRRSSSTGVNPDGTFTVDMPHGEGFRLGSYQITAKCLKSAYADPKTDRFKGAFADQDKTPLKVDIKDDSKQIIIDLGKGTATTE